MERRTYFTSDTHFHHTNVIRYCKRPFCTLRGDEPEPDVRFMNREMICRWNSAVGPRDIIYHLGDFAMGKRHEMKPILDQLNGYKILIKGNHDRSAQAMREAGFDEVHEEMFIPSTGGAPSVYLHHQPIRHWQRKGGGRHVDYHLCGHVHEKWRRLGNMINVGVDQWDFTPQALEVLVKAEKQGEIPTPEQMEE